MEGCTGRGLAGDCDATHGACRIAVVRKAQPRELLVYPCLGPQVYMPATQLAWLCPRHHHSQTGRAVDIPQQVRGVPDMNMLADLKASDPIGSCQCTCSIAERLCQVALRDDASREVLNVWHALKTRGAEAVHPVEEHIVAFTCTDVEHGWRRQGCSLLVGRRLLVKGLNHMDDRIGCVGKQPVLEVGRNQPSTRRAYGLAVARQNRDMVAAEHY